jgi:hypothetical protein
MNGSNDNQKSMHGTRPLKIAFMLLVFLVIYKQRELGVHTNRYFTTRDKIQPQLSRQYGML